MTKFTTWPVKGKSSRKKMRLMNYPKYSKDLTQSNNSSQQLKSLVRCRYCKTILKLINEAKTLYNQKFL